MKIIRNIPLFLFLLAFYNILEFSPITSAGENVLKIVLLKFEMMSGAMVVIDVSGLLIIIGLHALYFEILKYLRSSVTTIINHTLSMIVFIVFLVEFIVVKHAGTQSFLILTCMSLCAVISGFTVSITSARRDIVMER